MDSERYHALRRETHAEVQVEERTYELSPLVISSGREEENGNLTARRCNSGHFSPQLLMRNTVINHNNNNIFKVRMLTKIDLVLVRNTYSN